MTIRGERERGRERRSSVGMITTGVGEAERDPESDRLCSEVTTTGGRALRPLRPLR